MCTKTTCKVQKPPNISATPAVSPERVILSSNGVLAKPLLKPKTIFIFSFPFLAKRAEQIEMKAKHIGMIVGCLMAVGTWAQQPGVPAPPRSNNDHPPEVFTNCDNAQTQTELNLCAQLSFQKADQELNSIYKQLLSLLSKEDKALVIEAQRQWIAYRDAHCKFYEKMYAGGSMLTMVLANCKETTTQSRINELKELIAERKLRQ